MVATENEEQGSLNEVRAAVEALGTASLLRLKRYAEIRIRRVGRAARGRTAEDLLHDAFEATLSGRRHWRKSAVDLVGHLRGAMRSISSGWAESQNTETNREPVLECELIIDCEEGSAPSPLLQSPSPAPDPESIVTAKENLGIVRRFFCDDPLVLEIMDGLAVGMKGPEIWGALGITEKDYRAAVRRIDRNCRKCGL